MAHNLLIGIVPIWFVLWFLSGDIRTTAITGLTIPAAVSAAIGLLQLAGDDVRLHALGALDIAILIIVATIAVDQLHERIAIGAWAARFRRLRIDEGPE